MQTLQERIEEVMAAKAWSVGKVASVAGVSSSAVSQWLGRGGAKSSKSIRDFEVALRLQKESGFSAMWLANGKGPKHAEVLIESVQDKVNENHSDNRDIVKNEGNQGSPEKVSVDVGQNGESLCQPIPTSMTYSAPNFKSAILLMGSLIGALDRRSRRIIGELLKDLADEPDDAEDIANKASGIATIQKPLSKNKELNRAMRSRSRDPVETKPAPLEHEH